jgi:hypothetical protein
VLSAVLGLLLGRPEKDQSNMDLGRTLPVGLGVSVPVAANQGIAGGRIQLWTRPPEPNPALGARKTPSVVFSKAPCQRITGRRLFTAQADWAPLPPP